VYIKKKSEANLISSEEEKTQETSKGAMKVSEYHLCKIDLDCSVEKDISTFGSPQVFSYFQ